MTKEQEESEVEIHTLRCIGNDNKQHLCEPHKDTTLCGIPVKRKKELKHDYKLMSCYECTY